MVTWLQTYIRHVVGRYLDNESGQDVLVWLLVLFVIWLLVAGRRVVVQ
ncbi:MAG: hypothetical protein QN122_09700 [Armatimonadota bacterium]|nr:hypothetical protein [Armatimonadota bacterium]MDR7447630.1 hypothetical protein [Armatimonadota bacterium]MDR7459489.1 hypothetical protein [Armatimonadota bacterium]MDR7480067.1 hypothetical protein [Armatimonadota bacterium]MDR7488802.1 hypothetical protein [Armatimonadota bacterium]